MQRFWDKVHKTPTCWLWTGALAGGKAGQYRTLGVKYGVAHTLIGKIVRGQKWQHVA